MNSFLYFYIVLKSFLLLVFKSLLFWFGPIKSRLQFEKLNEKDIGSQSLSLKNMKASAVFFISSEGELEQVRALIDVYLENKEIIEIIFTSPSVESKVINLYKKNEEYVRYLRYPLTHYNFFFLQKWTTSNKVICCRYDIFPEMIPLIKEKKSILTSATTSYQKYQNLFIRNYYQYLYGLFDLIIWADEIDTRYSYKLNRVMDMRALRISKRLENSKTIIFQKRLDQFTEQVKEDNINIIWGSYWDHELEGMKTMGNQKLVVAPHILDSKYINQLQKSFESQGHKVAIVDSGYQKVQADIYIIITKGVLCELYRYFDHAIVGGGHGKSIHSVLEPYLAGCMVWHGPVYFRSTEHRYIKTQNENSINIILNLKDYFPTINKRQHKNQYGHYTSQESQDILSFVYRY